MTENQLWLNLTAEFDLDCQIHGMMVAVRTEEQEQHSPRP